MNKNTAKAIAVLGAGSWGTALAHHLAVNGQTVYLWGRDPMQIEKIQSSHTNQLYLPDIKLPTNVHPTSDLAEIVKNCNDYLVAVPSHAFRETLTKLKQFISPQRLIWATKGIDASSHKLLHEVVKEIFGDIQMAVLSGPNFAKEIAKCLPTAVTIATNNKTFAREMITRFHSKTFRVYTSDDIIGVEIGGAMKNVLAIAVGIADGLNLGANARSALITRGLTEMIRLGMALGAKQETFVGLSGLGDLILTCTDNQSRNRRFGLALANGKSAQAAEHEIGQVVEGIRTTIEIHYLATTYKIDTPICEQVYQVLEKGLDPITAVNNLLAREAKNEKL